MLACYSGRPARSPSGTLSARAASTYTSSRSFFRFAVVSRPPPHSSVRQYAQAVEKPHSSTEQKTAQAPTIQYVHVLDDKKTRNLGIFLARLPQPNTLKVIAIASNPAGNVPPELTSVGNQPSPPVCSRWVVLAAVTPMRCVWPLGARQSLRSRCSTLYLTLTASHARHVRSQDAILRLDESVVKKDDLLPMIDLLPTPEELKVA